MNSSGCISIELRIYLYIGRRSELVDYFEVLSAGNMSAGLLSSLSMPDLTTILTTGKPGTAGLSHPFGNLQHNVILLMGVPSGFYTPSVKSMLADKRVPWPLT